MTDAPKHTPGLVCAARVCYTSALCERLSMNARRVGGLVRFVLGHDVWRATDAGLLSGGNATPIKCGNIAGHGSADSAPNVPKSSTADGDSSEAKTECRKRGNVVRIGLQGVTLQPNNSLKSDSETRVVASIVAKPSETSDSIPKTREDLIMCAQEQSKGNIPPQTSSCAVDPVTPKKGRNPTAEPSHTKEPWKLKVTNDECVIYRPLPFGTGVLRVAEAPAPDGFAIAVLVKYGALSSPPRSCRAEANAARIVTCVNACAGIPTEALQAASADPATLVAKARDLGASASVLAYARLLAAVPKMLRVLQAIVASEKAYGPALGAGTPVGDILTDEIMADINSVLAEVEATPL